MSNPVIAIVAPPQIVTTVITKGLQGATGTLNSSTGMTVDGVGTITANSATPALTVTQTGAGNAFVVEDAASDTTPFVIDGGGRVNIGSSTWYIANALSASIPAKVQINGAAGSDGSLALNSWQAGTNTEAMLLFNRGDGSVIGDFSDASDSGDCLGSLKWSGSDGSAFAHGATIRTVVDGVVAANSVPGRIEFMTTAVGSATPVERLRIDSSGGVGIAGAAAAGQSFRIGRATTGNVSSYGMRIVSTIQSDVTSNAVMYDSTPSTVAAAFSLANLYHFIATQGTVGAGSTVATQYGFAAGNTLIGATNNFGFYGNIPAGTGRWNFYASGTADNYFAGNIGINKTTPLTKLHIGAASNVTTDYPIRVDNSSNNYATGYGAYGFSNRVNATNPSVDYTIDIGRNLYFRTADTDNRVVINSLGSVGIGTTALTGINMRIDKTLGGAVSAYGIYNIAQIQSDVTTQASMFRSLPSTAAADFTLPTLTHFEAYQSTFGAGSTVTTQYGFSVNSAMIGATNNFAFYGNIPAGTGRWNFYAAGTADNYLGGRLGIGSASISNVSLRIHLGVTGGTTAYSVYNSATIQSDVTSTAIGYGANLGTAAATFNLTSLKQFSAGQAAIGAGSTVATQYGFIAESSLTGATNNYGFYGNIAAGTGRYNFYAAGTADNYFAGNVGINRIPSSAAGFNFIEQCGHATNGGGYRLFNSTTSSEFRISMDATGALPSLGTVTSTPLSLITNATERMRIDSAGQVEFKNRIGVLMNPVSTVSCAISQSGADYTLGSNYSIYLQGNGYAGGIALNATSMQIGQNSGSRSLTFHSGSGFAERLRIDTSGNVLQVSAAGLGYGTGAGGTVIQATSKSTAVTLNKPSGQITMHNASLAAGTTAIFQVLCSLVVETDNVIVNVCTSGSSDGITSYSLRAGAIGNGYFFIAIKNEYTAALAEAVRINFSVIKGATA